MTFDPVPWLVAGGAIHSAEVARALPSMLSGDQQGVSSATALHVAALGTPGNQVAVAPGACIIRNTYAGQTDQAYVGRNTATLNSPTISPTSGSSRSDMIVARIDDPQYGGTTPADVTVGPYIRLAVVSNVGSTATEVPGSVTYPAIALARVDLPPGTTNITNAMITDLRTLLRPRRDREIITYNPSVDLVLTDISPSFGNWPVAAGHSLAIPSWATQAIVIAQVAGVGLTTPGADGSFRFKLGSDGSAVTGNYAQWNNVDVGGKTRLNFVAADKIAIPSAYRGTTKTLYLQGSLLHGTGDMRPDADGGSTIIIDVEFIETPSAS